MVKPDHDVARRLAIWQVRCCLRFPVCIHERSGLVTFLPTSMRHLLAIRLVVAGVYNLVATGAFQVFIFSRSGA